MIVALLSQTQESSHVFYQLHDLLLKITKEKQQGSGSTALTTRDVLLLTLHMYALMGDSLEIEVQHELYLQKAFVQAMLAVFASAAHPIVQPKGQPSRSLFLGRQGVPAAVPGISAPVPASRPQP